eukprot:5737764-Prymnesium_polylepis.1
MAMLRRLCAPRRQAAAALTAAQSPAHATATRKQLDLELTQVLDSTLQDHPRSDVGGSGIANFRVPPPGPALSPHRDIMLMIASM